VDTAACLHLRPGDAHWPAVLDTIDGPPAELWARGRLDVLDAEPRVAIVGSRSPTPYGEAQARRFAATLAERGVTIVSGLARGVDARAHDAALDAGGRTVAVLGSGVDRPWPGGEPAERVARDGMLLSEFAPGVTPRRHHFPLRNRLISGLSSVVLVVEAAHASGSLVTARWAADQGRTVMALPGRVDHPMARGCHRLLKEGAALAESPADVLAELGLDGPPARREHRVVRPVVAALEGETLTGAELAERLDRSLESVLVELVQCELDGEVLRSPGGLWRLAERGG
jgi:DNA processing protein